MPFSEIKSQADLDKIFQSAGGNLVIIDFSATWCGPCRMIGPVFHAMADEAEYANVHFVKVDVDESPELSEKYKVEAMPTFVFLKNQNEVDRLLGASKEQLAAKTKQHK
jgi:thioredoxin